MSRFWAAWQDVAADPTSTAARATLVAQAGTLASRFGRDAKQLDSIVGGIDAGLRGQIGSVNDIAVRIAALNEQIQRVTVAGDQPNDLTDQRDLLLDELNRYVPVTVEPQADGTVTVMIGGTDLVNHDRARRLVAADDGSGHVRPEWSTGGVVILGQGAMAGLVSVRDGELAAYRATLDSLAEAIADAVNAIHQTGGDQTDAAGLEFFTYTPGNAAGSLAVNAAIAADPRRVAAAAGPGTPGDGSIAGAIADLQLARIFGSGTQTPADAFAGLIGRIGTDSRQADEMAVNQSLVVGHLVQRRESISGVSLDEEAADMIRFQHAYTAAARVMTAYDELLDILINRTGIVGR
jgi:flagellar hook-associated protein 1 FlgK